MSIRDSDSAGEVTAAVDELFARRDQPARALADAAEPLVLACRDIAARFERGGKLLSFGSGGPTTDAQHVSVEFVHPVIVGKRALPALSLGADAATTMGLARDRGRDQVFVHQLSVLADADDIAVGISSDGNDDDVRCGLQAARGRGLTTIALVGGDGGDIARTDAAEYLIVVPSDDAQIVKEVHVTAYHLLWELTHVYLEHGRRSADEASPGTGSLYPFLYGGNDETGASTTEDAIVSTRAKTADIADLRHRVGTALGAELGACAAAMAAAFATGGRLLTCGNGGSSSDAQEVVQNFLAPPYDWQALPALCLTNDVAVLTALSNDVAYDVVFARQVRAFGRRGDMLMGLSTSGNSDNLIAAFEAARDIGMVTVGLAGSGGGRMASSGLLDHLLIVPSDSVHRIQETQTTLYHVLRELVERLLVSRAA